MTPGKISAKVVADKLEVIERMRSGVGQLPLDSEESSLSDPRNPAAGESYLRRMLMARYRNRMVHFYDEITPEEMYEILTARLGDVDAVLDAIRGWMDDHPELVDQSL